MYWNHDLVFTGNSFSGLIETWDVLKFDNSFTVREFIKINRNMRCIEMR